MNNRLLLRYKLRKSIEHLEGCIYAQRQIERMVSDKDKVIVYREFREDLEKVLKFFKSEFGG